MRVETLVSPSSGAVFGREISIIGGCRIDVSTSVIAAFMYAVMAAFTDDYAVAECVRATLLNMADVMRLGAFAKTVAFPSCLAKTANFFTAARALEALAL